MKVKDAVKLLLEQDQEKELFLEQGEIEDYMPAYVVKEKTLHNHYDDKEIKAVVIEYQ